MTSDPDSPIFYQPPADKRADIEEQQDSPFRLLELPEYINSAAVIGSTAMTALGLYIAYSETVLGGLFVAVLFSWVAQREFCGMSSRYTCTSCWLEDRRYREGATPGYWGLAYDGVMGCRRLLSAARGQGDRLASWLKATVPYLAIAYVSGYYLTAFGPLTGTPAMNASVIVVATIVFDRLFARLLMGSWTALVSDNSAPSTEVST